MNVPVLVSEVEIVSNEYDNLQWDNCDYNKEGQVVGVFGKLWDQLLVAKLLIICKKLQVYRIKKVQKEGILEAIVKTTTLVSIWKLVQI
jgi:hypothetical protein